MNNQNITNTEEDSDTIETEAPKGPAAQSDESDKPIGRHLTLEIGDTLHVRVTS